MGGIGFLMTRVTVRVYVVLLVLLGLHIHCSAAQVEAKSIVEDHHNFEFENATEGFIQNNESDNVSEGFIENSESDNLSEEFIGNLPGVGLESNFQLGGMLGRLKDVFDVVWRVLVRLPQFLIEISPFIFGLWQLMDKIRYRNPNLMFPSAKELEMQTIEKIFRLADDRQSFHFILNPRRSLSFDSARELNRGWRHVVGNHCSGLPFYSLITAFHKRYGIVSQSHNQPWPAQKVLNSKAKIAVEGETSNSSTIYLDCLSIEQILARLPLPSLMRMKCVSKTWKNIICASPSFWSLYNSLNSNYLVVQHTTEGSHGIIFFSPSLNHWFRIPLPLQWRKQNVSHFNPPSVVQLCAVGGGLFLFVDWDSGEISNPVVLNPLTKQYMVLPDFPFHQNWQTELAFELITDLSSNHFKVIVISSNIGDPSKVCSLIYNSSSNMWKTGNARGARPWRSIGHPWWRTTAHPWRSTVHEAVVYCTSTYGVHVACYNIHSAEFEYLEIEERLPQLVDYLDSDENPHATLPSLVVCGEKLILVGRLQSPRSILGRLPVIKHSLVGLWELDLRLKSKSWSLISESPLDLLEAAVKSSDGTDFLVASDGRDGIWFMLRGSKNLLRFNLSSMEWSLLPGCPGEDIMDTSTRRAFSTPFRISPHC
ncbi:uncharacterized protein LOC131076882 [Cryptomeria japonica]|uniref:uncharacterized protein LOC131076882 n=1 Tax=Cryptomeria japonica TaxID=3369 RepID=UPI0027DA0FCA|nr:uncharacterized protein LOC131076882 [Cryptomeria japonica]XP_057870211.2 uncharacterized protein LOC131076882 [Cryptomeria japonica]XP_057870212.2 uncharacterized protein LOC131076882 [Cryptomeria japonica]